MFAVGVDIGGTSIKLGIFSIEGDLLKKWEIKTDISENGKNIFKDIANTIMTNIKELSFNIEDCKGIGIGLPGAVDKNNHIEVCVNLGFRDVYPVDILSRLLCVKNIKISNDANVAALGETWKGGASLYNNVVMITLGTGVGGGIVIDNKILNGTNGLAGEIGHLHIRDDESKACNCGDHGCLEQIASATGVRNEALKLLEISKEDSILRQYGNELTAKNVFDAAKSGDEIALEVLDTVYKYLGLIVSHIAKIIDPEAFVIGGGVSKAGDMIIDGIFKYYDKYTSLTKKRADIVLAKLGNDAGIYGAAKLIID